MAEVMLYIPQRHTEIGGLRKNTVPSVTVHPGHDIMVTGSIPQSIDYNIVAWLLDYVYFEAHLFWLPLTDLFLLTGKMSCKNLHKTSK